MIVKIFPPFNTRKQRMIGVIYNSNNELQFIILQAHYQNIIIYIFLLIIPVI